MKTWESLSLERLNKLATSTHRNLSLKLNFSINFLSLFFHLYTPQMDPLKLLSEWKLRKFYSTKLRSMALENPILSSDFHFNEGSWKFFRIKMESLKRPDIFSHKNPSLFVFVLEGKIQFIRFSGLGKKFMQSIFHIIILFPLTLDTKERKSSLSFLGFHII